MQIQILASIIFYLAACQQDQGTALSPATALVLQASVAGQQAPEKSPVATNIVFKSVDGGQTWQDVSAGLPKNLGVGRVFANDGEVFLCAEKTLYHSSTRSPAPAWEPDLFWDTDISDIFPGRDGPYLSSYQNGFFKTLPGSGVLLSMHDALEDKTVRTVLETRDGILFVGCESGLYKSADAGKSWKQVFSEVGVNSLVEAEGVLVCGTYDGLIRSTDGGEHWDSKMTEDGGAWKTGFFDGHFVAITQGPKSWQQGAQNRLRISGDGGKTWQRMDENLSSDKEAELTPVLNINDIKMAGQYLFCSCDAGIFRSSDWGKNWEPVFVESGLKLLQLAVSGNAIYAVKVFGC